MGRIYATKVDWWIGLILIFTLAVLIGSAFPFFFGPPAQTPLGLGIGVLCLAIAVWIGWIPYNTNYEIGQTQLIVRSAGFRWRVPLDAIVEVFPTHNPLSSPACSLDRLRMNYRNRKGRMKFVLISPREGRLLTESR
ncbi:MAG: PH domain-containing protein [Planctomycetales bacterium]|nr:PH domain-containing protein [Planctomycetales bacterium]